MIKVDARNEYRELCRRIENEDVESFICEIALSLESISRKDRPIQLGLRGDVIAKYAREWIPDIQDISGFVAEQRSHAKSRDYDRLFTPTEFAYPVTNGDVAGKLGLSTLA
ncbi:DUF4291 family protein [Leptothoe sp. LEGE 181152]|nr:DUF4291 family protein [Leptothoe sp. LEGE 181152]